MSDPIRPDALLRQARLLAGFGAGRGRPSPTNHRRAVSAAYYALFHDLAAACIDEVLRVETSDSERYRALRWIDHSDIRRVCTWVTSVNSVSGPSKGRPKSVPRNGTWELFTRPVVDGREPAVSNNLALVADAFVSLQAARHDADYNHGASFSKATAGTHVVTAEQAVGRLRASTADPSFRRFFVLVLAASSRVKS